MNQEMRRQTSGCGTEESMEVAKYSWLQNRKSKEGCSCRNYYGCGSLLKHLSYMHEVLYSMLILVEKKKKRKRRGGKEVGEKQE